MRFSIIKIVFRTELREMLRDRRSLTIMFGIPLVLYPILLLLIGSIGMSKKKQFTETPARVAVVNAEAAPELIGLLAGKDSGCTMAMTETPEADLTAGKIDAVVVVPDNTQADALAGKEPQITVKLDRSRTQSAFIESKVTRILNNYDRWVVEQRLRAHGQPAELLKPLKHEVVDVASADQRFGKLLSMSLPVLLLVTGMLGALFPALNATTTERELGTLETLLVTPAGRMELLVAKGTLVLLSGLLTAGLNMLSMSLVIWRSLSLFETSMGSLRINLSALALTYLAAVPTLITFTTLVLIVGLLARTFREANHLATPVMMIPLASMLIGIWEPEMSPGLLVTPVANTTLIIKEVLTGRITAGPFVIAFISSMVYAGLFLSLATRVFSNEQLVNPSWEPVSFKGLRSVGSRVRQRRLPSVDEALTLFAIVLLLTFYIQPSLMRFGAIQTMLVSQLILIAGPAIAMAALGKYRWVETFSWRRPMPFALIGALLLGIGLAPLSQLIQGLQERVWPPNRESQEILLKFLLPSIEHYPLLVPVLIGLLAGLCEETLFRGPIQTGLLRRIPRTTAIVIGGLLFAAAHLDLYGLPIRTLLGILLGWIVVRSGSVFPAMATHAAFDITQLLDLSGKVRRYGGAQGLLEAARAGRGEEISNTLLLGALVLAVVGMMLLLWSAPPAQPEQLQQAPSSA
jgi:sodium transport system permease protein